MTKSFGRLLRDVRKQQRLTLGELARKLGKSVSYVSDIEHDRRAALSSSTVVELSEAIGVDPNPLLMASIRQRQSIDVKNASPTTISLMAGLARKLDTMPDEKKMQLLAELLDSEVGE